MIVRCPFSLLLVKIKSALVTLSLFFSRPACLRHFTKAAESSVSTFLFPLPKEQCLMYSALKSAFFLYSRGTFGALSSACDGLLSPVNALYQLENSR